VKLSDAQERALIDLAPSGYPIPEEATWREAGGLRGPRTNTLDSLVRLGLAEERVVRPRLRWEYRITAAGLDLLRTMGD
jgi:hypothetical protein